MPKDVAMLSSLLDRFNEPETLKMARLGRELRASGVNVVDLSLGEPDFDTPDIIKEAAIAAIRNNFSHYPPVAGYPELRQTICDKLKRENNLTYSPLQTLVSTGAKQCIANLVLALIDEQDEVLIPTPYWVTYSELVKMAGGIPVMIPSEAKEGFKIAPAQLEAHLNDRTKLFMISSPCNPTGAVYSKAEIQGLANVMERFPQLIIMSDEIYEYINYVGDHASFAAVDSLYHRTVIINGLSKGYAMTGYRLGYMAGPEKIIKACEKIQGQVTSGANAMTQQAAITALKHGRDLSTGMAEAFERRRTLILEELTTVPYFRCQAPEGAFYVFPEVKESFGKRAGHIKINGADDLCMYLLNEAHVTSVSGKAFGNENHIRLSFANSEANIKEGMARIRKAMQSLQ